MLKLPEAKPLEPVPAGVEHYIREVWAEHCERRGDEFPLMSSAEFSLACGWWEQGVPLRIVLRAMKDTQGSGTRLSYYRSPVEAAHRMWMKALGPYDEQGNLREGWR